MKATELKAYKGLLVALSVAVVISIILGVVALVNHGNTMTNTIPGIDQQMSHIKNTLPELEAVSTELKGYIDTLETTVEKLQTDLTAVGTTIDTLETEVYGKVDAEKTATLNQLKADKAELEGKIAAANKAIEDAKTANTASEKAITDQIAALEAELEKADADNKKALEEQIATLNINLSALIKANADNIAALQTTAADLQTQINTVNTNIASLKTELEGKISESEQKVLGELNTLKTSIEGQLTTVNADIAALKAKDTELDGKITDLKAYVDGEITATEAWANATFATLTQYDAIQAEIAGIKQSITDINADITAIEADVKAQVEAINKSIADLDAELAAEVKKVTDGYTTAISAAKTEIETAYTKAIADAITASETSMKAWVNEILADGYYDIATVDARLSALETKLHNADVELSEDIEDQKAALEQAKTDLTAAYRKAITDAIETNNGAINAAIAQAIEAALDIVNTKLALIDNTIAAIRRDIEEISKRIVTIEERIEELSDSLEDLSAGDAALQKLVGDLKAEIAELQAQVDTLKEQVAKCPANQYTIYFDTDGGTTIAAITQQAGTAVTPPAAPTKTGYTFAGWDREIPAEMPTENITIKAIWIVKTNTIIFNTDGGSAIAAITQQPGTAVTPPADPTKPGHTFAGWDKAIPTVMPSENITIKAMWTTNTYVVRWVNDGGAELETDPAVPYGTKPSYNGSTPTKAATAEYSYRFTGWSPAVKNITGDTTYTATYEATKKQSLEGCAYNQGDVVIATSNMAEYCTGCGRLLNNYTVTITGLRGTLDGKPIYWVTRHCCGHKTSVIETAIVRKQ